MSRTLCQKFNHILFCCNGWGAIGFGTGGCNVDGFLSNECSSNKCVVGKCKKLLIQLRCCKYRLIIVFDEHRLVCRAVKFINKNKCLNFIKSFLNNVNWFDAFYLNGDIQIGELLVDCSWLSFTFWHFCNEDTPSADI